MDMFLQETIGTERFLRRRIKTMHYVCVLFSDFTVDFLVEYQSENDKLSPHRDDAWEFDQISKAELECDILIAQGFDASVETFQRFYQ